MFRSPRLFSVLINENLRIDAQRYPRLSREQRRVAAERLNSNARKLNDVDANESSIEDSSDNFIIDMDERRGDGANLNLT